MGLGNSEQMIQQTKMAAILKRLDSIEVSLGNIRKEVYCASSTTMGTAVPKKTIHLKGRIDELEKRIHKLENPHIPGSMV